MESIVKIDGESISKVAITLIEKVSSAIGWVVERDTPNKIATKEYIESIQKSNLPAIEKAAFISNANKIIKEYTNQRNIVNYAINALDPVSRPENIDDDWLIHFMDKARLVSDSDIQMIWGKILREECTHPHRIPKSLVYILSQIDKSDAEVFTSLCSISAYFIDKNQKKYFPIVSNTSADNFYANLGITYDSLSELQALGLLQIDFSTPYGSYKLHSSNKPIKIHYFDECFEIPDNKNDFLCGNVIYTKAGESLCSAIDTMKHDGFFEKYGIPLFQKEGTEWIDEIFDK